MDELPADQRLEQSPLLLEIHLSGDVNWIPVNHRIIKLSSAILSVMVGFCLGLGPPA